MQPILLDRNENQHGPSPLCYEVLRSAHLEQMSLYSRTYLSGIKSELSQHISAITGIPEDRVLLSYGSEDMLKQVVHCYLGAGDSILLPRQSWWYYKRVVSEVSGKPVEYSIKEVDDRFSYDISEISALYDRHRPAILLIASPNNPTGNIIEPEDLGQLIRHCSSSVIVLDEAYYGFSGDVPNHLLGLVDTHDRLIILRTFSKYFALAGLRIGYSCIGKDLGKLVQFSARYLGYNQLTEKIAFAALSSREYYERVAAEIRDENGMYYDWFGGLPGFIPFRTQANFILVRYPRAMKAALQAGLLAHGVAVKFLDDPGLDDCIRITIGTRDQNSRVREAFSDSIRKLSINITPSRNRP